MKTGKQCRGSEISSCWRYTSLRLRYCTAASIITHFVILPQTHALSTNIDTMVTVVGKPTAESQHVVIGKPVANSSSSPTSATAVRVEALVQELDIRHEEETDPRKVLHEEAEQTREGVEIQLQKKRTTTSGCYACIDPSVTLEDSETAEAATQNADTGKTEKEQLIETKSEKAIYDDVSKALESPDSKTGEIAPTTPNEESPLVKSIKKASEPTVLDRLFACFNPVSYSEDPDSTDDDDDFGEIKFNGEDLESLPTANLPGSVAGDLSFAVGKSIAAGTTNGNVASMVESKARAIQLPTAPDAPQGENSPTIKSNESADFRRNRLVKDLKHVISTYGRYDIRCANISLDLGELLAQNGQHEQAVKLHKDAVTIYSCKLGDNNATTLNAKLRLGKVLEKSGEYDEAIEIYYAVIAMRRAIKGEEDPSVADGYVHMAHTLRLMKEYHLAIRELKRALRIYRETLGDSDPKVSVTVDDIASLYVTIGDFRKSAAILEEVVKLKAATCGPKDEQVAATLVALANSHEQAGDTTKAMKSLKNAYKIYTESAGYSSEAATHTLNRMAQLYEAMADYNRSSIAYLGVLRAYKTRYGNDNLVVGEIYYKLGHALHETGQIEKALKCLKEALPIYVKKSSKLSDVETIAEIMHELALINKEKKCHVDAARIFKQELDVRQRIGQAEYPTIARNLNHLGVAEYELANHTRALKYFVEALGIFQTEGEDSLDCAEVLFNTGLVFEAVKNNERALEAYVEAARIFEENGYERNHPHLTRAQHKVEKLSRMVETAKGPTSTGIMKRLFR